ncbi:hypothetical protein EUA93_14590 [Nocardioides oleivorans]|uniref:Uncharacterized protein n=1 Tax=Nocardioides oleivorans TaxID=273676 RepID=A0A4V1RLE1_9ACTN|nr:hypothetical protein [Nocardioides oleivorans]RYB95462.1 hypothetical protein EUA93_14590 [Nocardioides oleivorans]
MNTTELPVRPDVSAFVARVRELLDDLSDEDRLELTEGLEADLTDQVAEHGGAVLGDPVEYARELRAAAGFEPAARPSILRGGVGLGDLAREGVERWDRWISHPRVAPVWQGILVLRPAWWVLRAWAAAVVVARLVPGWYDYGFVWLPGVEQATALLILLVCVVGSTLVGLGRVWPGGSTAVLARTVLLLLNLGAILAVPVILGQLEQQSWNRYDDGYSDGQWDAGQGGLTNRGNEVCNISAYDAEGQPLTGVQLFDQSGRPLAVGCYDQQAVKVPWVLGDVTRWNVYPLGERDRPARSERRRADLTGAAFPTPDRATAPEVTNPLVPEPRSRDGRADEKEAEGKRSDREDGRSGGTAYDRRR